MVCQKCNGLGWLVRRVDCSSVYGRDVSNTYTRICPTCEGKRYVSDPLPSVVGKDAAAGREND